MSSRYLATVLYEDSMSTGPSGHYPLHDLVLRTCVKEHQPGLAALAHAIAALINDKGQLILP